MKLHRVLHSNAGQREASELLQSVLAGELIRPSTRLWLVSPWISDIPVIDNGADAFSKLEPAWARSEVLLSQVLGYLAASGTDCRIVYRDDGRSAAFIGALNRRERELAVQFTLIPTEPLHEKHLLTDAVYLTGSMNFTHGGTERYDEGIHLHIDPPLIHGEHLEFEKRWGRR